MAPTLQTQDDPNLKEPSFGRLNGFDPLAVLGFSINDPAPGEDAIHARYRRVARLVGILHRDDQRLPYTIEDVNRARDSLLSNYRLVVEITRGYHRPMWNLDAHERDLVGLLSPSPATARVGQTGPTSGPTSGPTPVTSGHNLLLASTSMNTCYSEIQTPPPGSEHGRRQFSGETPENSDDDCFIVASRSSISSRKNPISESTKREMRQFRDAEDESRLRSKENKGKKAQLKKPEADEYDELECLGTGNEIPGYIMVGNDRRAGHGGRLVVMGLDVRNRANFYALEPSHTQIEHFRLRRLNYDDIDQSPVVLTRLRNANEIAANHVRASRDELKMYYKLVSTQQAMDAQSGQS